MSEPYALACDMTALSPDERKRHHEVMTRVVAAIRQQTELPDGYAFQLDPDVPVAEVGAWIALETRCCPFLRLVMEVGPGGLVKLELTGPGDVKAFLLAELGLRSTRRPAP